MWGQINEVKNLVNIKSKIKSLIKKLKLTY